MILIDMDMPDNCEECKICQWDEIAIEDYCPFTETAVPSTGRLPDCPLREPVMRWIPCEERLPGEQKNRYWVCTDTGYQCECRWTDDVYGLGSNGKWAWKIFDIPQYSHVVAWMPLPEPYKGDAE